MAQWYQFYHTEDDAEIMVGLYDRWLSRLDFGPSQAERFLLHTEMMEMAHERRFAIAQTGSDMSGFEKDHSRRITEAIEHLERNFISKPYEASTPTELAVHHHHQRKVSHTKIEDTERIRDDSLVEMMAWADHTTADERQRNHTDKSRAFLPPPPPPSQWLESTLQTSTTSALELRPQTDIEPEVDVDDTSSDGFTEEQYRAALLNLTFADTASKRRWGSSNGAKINKEIRIRKKPRLQHYDKVKTIPTFGAHNTTNMSLNVMLN